MHTILWRQLKRLQVDPDHPPADDNWAKFLAAVDHTYTQADQDRYLLERSLAISSKETQDLYDEEQRRIKEALKVSEGKYRTLFEHAVDSIFIIDATSRKILDLNQIAADRLGYTRDELLNMSIDDIYPPFELEGNADIVKKLHAAGHLRFERIHVRKDGSTIQVDVTSSLLEQDGKLVYQSIVRDVSQQKAFERELQRLANYDSLTGVANRTLFIDRIAHAIDLARRTNDKLAVLFLDLDGFKAVNDAFGHERGDTLLQIIARRILESVRKSDTVARLGGDEFAILLEGVTNTSETLPIVQKVIESVAQPFVLQDAEAFITSSVGISFFPTDGEDPDTLIQNADRAMYLSKAEGKNSYRVFTPAMKTQALQRLELGNQLRHALENNELRVFYQTVVDSRTGQVLGVEALCRWDHPTSGILLPDQFVPLAEEMGLILPISDWVLHTACSQLQTWIAEGTAPLRLAVNLSDRDLNNPDLVSRIEEVLSQTGLAPSLLELELSENTIFRDLEKTQDVLVQLKNLGVRLAIDDFGTGYSTLIQLARFHFDTLKIDRRFASQLSSSAAHAAIVNGIVTIARELDMNVIAEGVEDRQQLAIYEAAGCFQIQGWLFSEPAPEEEIKDLVQSSTLR